MRTGISWLDVKLGARMLVKYPGLTLVGGLAMAVAIAIGATSSQAFHALTAPALPLDDGERVVGIQNWDAAANRPELRSLHDFVGWREEVKSVQELGAFRSIGRNLIVPNGSTGPVTAAEVTASGFRVARVPALLGRTLAAEDEREGAPPVLVIGYDAWKSRFAGDPGVVGREVRLGNAVHTIVGVMPEGFAFPVNHGFWVPLRVGPSDYGRRQGPEVFVFGRLAPGATLGEAEAEMTAIGNKAATAFPDTHERLRPRVLPYTGLWFDGEAAWVLQLMQLLISMLLAVVCVNVAILVYARTAARGGEIAVRNALGASRRRIVTQLFVEALVLAGGAAVLGLVLARLALRPVKTALVGDAGGELPFWVDFGLSPGTILYVVGLVALASVIVGVVPGMKATGRQLQSSLRELGGGTGMKLGGTWTALIVAQVAVAVAVMPGAGLMGWELIRYGLTEPGFPAEEFLTARLEMDEQGGPSADTAASRRESESRFASFQAELVRRLEAEPGVSDVTFASHVPGANEMPGSVEVDGESAPAGSISGHQVQFLHVAVDFFDAFNVPVLTGRRFHAGDVSDEATAVVVNRNFVQQYLGGGNPLGRRLRYVETGEWAPPSGAEPERWYEIVGVVGNLPPNAIEPGVPAAKVYHVLAPRQVHSVSLAVHVQRGTPAAFAGRLRELTTALDPTLRLSEILPLDEVYRKDRLELHLMALAIGLVTLSVFLLSVAGIYALMSLTVTQRRREIGIRSALGAHPGQIVKAIFSRALSQLAVGLAVGGVAAAAIDRLAGGQLMNGQGLVVLPGVAALMAAVGLLAVVAPARRGLRIQPTEALREG
jgi:predicted permease